MWWHLYSHLLSSFSWFKALAPRVFRSCVGFPVHQNCVACWVVEYVSDEMFLSMSQVAFAQNWIGSMPALFPPYHTTHLPSTFHLSFCPFLCQCHYFLTQTLQLFPRYSFFLPIFRLLWVFLYSFSHLQAVSCFSATCISFHWHQDNDTQFMQMN